MKFFPNYKSIVAVAMVMAILTPSVVMAVTLTNEPVYGGPILITPNINNGGFSGQNCDTSIFGVIIGTLIGAAVGSGVPIVGTAIGALAGGLIGGGIGGKLSGQGFMDAVYCAGAKMFSVIITTVFGALSAMTAFILRLCFGLVRVMISLNETIANNQFLDVGKNAILNLANAFLIIALIVIAIGTIVRSRSYSAKALLKSYIIIALLVNFAIPISLFIVSAGNAFTGIFASNVYNTDFGTSIGALFNVDSIIGASLPDNPNSSNATQGAIVGGLGIAMRAVLGFLFIIGFLFLGIAVFLGMALILLIRFIILNLLVVLAPLGFALGVLPITKDASSRWWSTFLRWVFVGPIMLLFVGITFNVMNSFSGANSTFNTYAQNDAQNMANLEAPIFNTVQSCSGNVSGSASTDVPPGGGSGGSSLTGVWQKMCQREQDMLDECTNSPFAGTPKICDLEQRALKDCQDYVKQLQGGSSGGGGGGGTEPSSCTPTPVPSNLPSGHSLIGTPPGVPPLAPANGPFANLTQVIIILGFLAGSMIAANSLGIKAAGATLAYAKSAGTNIAKWTAGKAATQILSMPAGKDAQGNQLNLAQQMGRQVGRFAPQLGGKIAGAGQQMSKERYDSAKKDFDGYTAGQRNDMSQGFGYRQMPFYKQAALASSRLEHGETLRADEWKTLQRGGMLGGAIKDRKLSAENLNGINSMDTLSQHDRAEVASRMNEKGTLTPASANYQKNIQALAHTNRLDKEFMENAKPETVRDINQNSEFAEIRQNMSPSERSAMVSQLNRQGEFNRVGKPVAGSSPAAMEQYENYQKNVQTVAQSTQFDKEFVEKADKGTLEDAVNNPETRKLIPADRIKQIEKRFPSLAGGGDFNSVRKTTSGLSREEAGKLSVDELGDRVVASGITPTQMVNMSKPQKDQLEKTYNATLQANPNVVVRINQITQMEKDLTEARGTNPAAAASIQAALVKERGTLRTEIDAMKTQIEKDSATNLLAVKGGRELGTPGTPPPTPPQPASPPSPPPQPPSPPAPSPIVGPGGKPANQGGGSSPSNVRSRKTYT